MNLNEPQFKNRNKINNFGFSQVDDGILTSKNKKTYRPNNKIVFEEEKRTIEWDNEIDTHSARVRNIHQEKYSSGLQLNFDTTNMKISDRITNKKIMDNGQNPNYIPPKTFMDKIYSALKITNPVNHDESTITHQQVWKI